MREALAHANREFNQPIFYEAAMPYIHIDYLVEYSSTEMDRVLQEDRQRYADAHNDIPF